MLGIFILIVFFSFIVIAIQCFIKIIETLYCNYKTIEIGEHYYNINEVIVNKIDGKYVDVKTANGQEYKLTKKELLLNYNKL